MPSLSFLKDPENKVSDTELSDSFEKQSKFLEDTLLRLWNYGKNKKSQCRSSSYSCMNLNLPLELKLQKLLIYQMILLEVPAQLQLSVATVPGKNTIGIEIPNKNIEPVYLKEILSSKEFAK